MTGVCRRDGCGHAYTAHEDRGGRCLHPAGVGCWCRGFLWIDPAPPPDGDELGTSLRRLEALMAAADQRRRTPADHRE